MSDQENIEVEVSDEVTPQDAIRNMMDKWADGDLTGAQDEFYSIMNKRADDISQSERQKLSRKFLTIQKCKQWG